ncbi:hypothetical protein [Rhizobium leguminosarum]|uniref:hypothetical protein n=1 Tax=Rhizobium leguminosarum TaxID=384 RepID=UPI0014417A72|nr:hypothetical protein [Rhizobium leguminosarum]NKL94194.1 hypothetical protein [Rhizobium leguminosarum bv. viciae]
MSKAPIASGPTKFTSGNLTLFEVRVLGIFVSSFLDLATALGVEADAVKNLIAQEILDKENFPEAASGDDDRLFEATWTDPSGKKHIRYTALISKEWTPAFEAVEDLSTSALRF